jgi:hypothetical protein
MTTDSSTAATDGANSSRPSWLVPVIVIVVIVVLAGGAYVVYKLTASNDTTDPPVTVVHRAIVAIRAGDPGKADSDATTQGQAQLAKVTASDISGMKFGGCPASGQTDSRTCIWSRPGGQMTMTLTKVGGAWKIDTVTVGPAGLPPSTDTTGSTTTTPPSS